MDVNDGKIFKKVNNTLIFYEETIFTLIKISNSYIDIKLNLGRPVVADPAVQCASLC